METEVYESLFRLEDSHWWFRGRRAIVDALIRVDELPGSPRLLDAGCGTGRNLLELGRLGDAVGVDASQTAVEYCRRRGLTDVHRAPLDDLPFQDDEFDVILITDVIEHITDDAAALSELRRVARPGAQLILTTPAYRWLWSHQDESHHHKRRYTRPAIVSVAASAGWATEAATYFNTFLLPPIAAVRKLGRPLVGSEREDVELTPGPLNRALAAPMRLEARMIRAGMRFPAGVSIGLRCRAAGKPGLPGPARVLGDDATASR